MRVELINGTQLDALEVRGYVVTFQNAQRDCLEFHFDAEIYSIDDIDKIFTRENCTVIKLTDMENSPDHTDIHRDYCIRKSLKKTTDHSYGGQVTLGSLQHDADDERVIVEMAQLTEAEKIQADLLDAVDTLIINSLE